MAELSGGWQRRMSFAAAVLSEPEVLLLDEPTVGLDPLAVREVHAHLRTVMRGRTVLLCTHNLAEAEALCDSALILRGGHVLLHERSAGFDLDAVDTLSTEVLGATLCGARGAYRFTLAAATRATPLQVECEEHMLGQKAEVGRVGPGTVEVSGSGNRVSCRLADGRVELTQTRRIEGATTLAPIVEGTARVGAVKLTVESSSRQEDGLPVPYLGFHLRRGERLVASVQAHEPSRLWLAPALSPEEREAVVLTAFTLVLQRTWTGSGPLDCDSH